MARKAWRGKCQWSSLLLAASLGAVGRACLGFLVQQAPERTGEWNGQQGRHHLPQVPGHVDADTCYQRCAGGQGSQGGGRYGGGADHPAPGEQYPEGGGQNPEEQRAQGQARPAVGTLSRRGEEALHQPKGGVPQRCAQVGEGGDRSGQGQRAGCLPLERVHQWQADAGEGHGDRVRESGRPAVVGRATECHDTLKSGRQESDGHMAAGNDHSDDSGRYSGPFRGPEGQAQPMGGWWRADDSAIEEDFSGTTDAHYSASGKVASHHPAGRLGSRRSRECGLLFGAIDPSGLRPLPCVPGSVGQAMLARPSPPRLDSEGMTSFAAAGHQPKTSPVKPCPPVWQGKNSVGPRREQKDCSAEGAGIGAWSHCQLHLGRWRRGRCPECRPHCYGVGAIFCASSFSEELYVGEIVTGDSVHVISYVHGICWWFFPFSSLQGFSGCGLRNFAAPDSVRVGPDGHDDATLSYRQDAGYIGEYLCLDSVQAISYQDGLCLEYDIQHSPLENSGMAVGAVANDTTFCGGDEFAQCHCAGGGGLVSDVSTQLRQGSMEIALYFLFWPFPATRQVQQHVLLAAPCGILEGGLTVVQHKASLETMQIEDVILLGMMELWDLSGRRVCRSLPRRWLLCSGSFSLESS